MCTPSANSLISKLESYADPQRALGQLRFFKTGKGQYGEGDIFWGITVPIVRAAAKEYKNLPLNEVEILLNHATHEVRLCGLLVLVEAFKKADEQKRGAIMALYLKRTDRINNWDLVDLSVNMLGMWLLDKDRALLYTLAVGTTMWEQRMAVVATNVFIRAGDFTDILQLCRQLMGHPHDLMHKAMGWMLREVGKKDRAVLTDFLQHEWQRMPRTMLRYAIEHYPEVERKAWLQRRTSSYR